MIDRARESRNPKKVIRVTLMESYGEIGRVPVNLIWIHVLRPPFRQISASSTKILFHHEVRFHVVHFISSQKPGITVEAYLSAL